MKKYFVPFIITLLVNCICFLILPTISTYIVIVVIPGIFFGISLALSFWFLGITKRLDRVWVSTIIGSFVTSIIGDIGLFLLAISNPNGIPFLPTMIGISFASIAGSYVSFSFLKDAFGNATKGTTAVILSSLIGGILISIDYTYTISYKILSHINPTMQHAQDKYLSIIIWEIIMVITYTVIFSNFKNSIAQKENTTSSV